MTRSQSSLVASGPHGGRTLRTTGRCAGLLVLAWVGVVAGGAARGAFADYQLEKLAMEGDPDPVSGTLQVIFGEVAIDADGRVALWGQVDGQAKLFAVAGGVPRVEVASGDIAPETGGMTLTDVARPRLAAPDALAFLGSYAGKLGGFVQAGGLGSAMALPGDALAAGGTIARVTRIPLGRGRTATSWASRARRRPSSATRGSSPSRPRSWTRRRRSSCAP